MKNVGPNQKKSPAFEISSNRRLPPAGGGVRGGMPVFVILIGQGRAVKRGELYVLYLIVLLSTSTGSESRG
jgi:hypothetical protein